MSQESSDLTAIVISIVSASIALGTLGWQLILYRLSGPRLRVKLEPALCKDGYKVVSGPERGWNYSSLRIYASDNWCLDLAKITVTNIGRAAVSTSAVGLDFGRNWWRYPWSRDVMVPHPVKISGGNAAKTVRLEPGSSIVEYSDVWPLLQNQLSYAHRGRITVRATVTAAGRRAKRSRWRSRWSIEGAQWRLRQKDRPGNFAEVEAFEELWRNIGFDLLSDQLVRRTWQTIQPRLAEVRNGMDLVPDLDSFIDDTDKIRVSLAVCRSVAEYQRCVKTRDRVPGDDPAS